MVKNLPANARDAGSIPAWLRKVPRRRKWQPTPVFLPGKSHGQRSLAGYCPLGCRVGHVVESEEELKSLLMKVKEESEKAG